MSSESPSYTAKETNVRCRDCPRYDSENERCRDSKVNPDNWETAVCVAQVMGLRSICIFNDHRERLIASRSQTAPGIPRPSSMPRRP